MDQQERDRIIEFCREVDSIVTEDPGCSNWEKLDRLRQKMNDLVMTDRLTLAEDKGYKILLLWSGRNHESLSC
jgi:glycerol-3-phosphate cytidylyltransferase-like family protein